MRETGPIRKNGVGDTGDPGAAEAAAPYIGAARVLLGQLKNRMRMGGLLQLVRSVVLEDGTRITVSSRFGQDAVQIVPAPTNVPVNLPVIPAPHIPHEHFEFQPPPEIILPPNIIVAGAYFTNQGASLPYSTAAVWAGGQVSRVIPNAGGMNVGLASAISKNGGKVAGHAFNQSTNGIGLGFLYAKGALQTFVFNDPDSGDPTAEDWTISNGITPNGATIVGYGSITLAGTTTPFIWTASSGISPLTFPAGYTISGTANAISADGKTIVGAVSNSSNHNIPTACTWTAAATHGEVFNPATGWSATPAFTPALLDNGGADGSYATGVSQDGKIIVGAALWYSGQRTQPCYWENGVMTLLPSTLGNSMAYGVSLDGSTIVGSTDVLNLVENEGFGGAYWSGLGSNLYTPWAGLTTQAFYWTKAHGIKVIGGGAALAASSDGTYITGWDANGLPVVWQKGGQPIPLALPGGAYAGCGAAITTG